MSNNPTTPPASSAFKATPVLIGNAVLLLSFVLPWIGGLGLTLSGFELNKIFPNAEFLWLIPVLTVTSIALEMRGQRYIEVAQIGGGIPLIAIAVVLYQRGGEFMGLIELFQVGTWLALISGLFLLCVAPRMMRKKVAVAATPSSM